jgi:hypothetical protein
MVEFIAENWGRFIFYFFFAKKDVLLYEINANANSYSQNDSFQISIKFFNIYILDGI